METVPKIEYRYLNFEAKTGEPTIDWSKPKAMIEVLKVICSNPTIGQQGFRISQMLPVGGTLHVIFERITVEEKAEKIETATSLPPFDLGPHGQRW